MQTAGLIPSRNTHSNAETRKRKPAPKAPGLIAGNMRKRKK